MIIGARHKVISIIMMIALAIGLQSSLALVQQALVFDNGTQIDYLRYDRANTSISGDIVYGSDSYMDGSPTIPNLFLDLCHQNLTMGSQVELAYYSESRNQTDSVMNFFPQPRYVNAFADGGGPYYCSRLDVDLASTKVLYPGRLVTLIHPYASPQENVTVNTTSIMLDPLSQNLSGSYKIGITVIGPPKTFFISPLDVYDELGRSIIRKESHLVFSLVNTNHTTLAEGKISPDEALAYSGNFYGGEQVYVNGLLSLEVKSYRPCDPLNESGYYIMNESKFNLSETCVRINASQEILLNFGNEILSGDNQENGSLRDDSCAVIITDSVNITLENVNAQLYNKGICVFNSSVYIFGLGLVYNQIGAYVADNSTVKVIDLVLNNNNSEIASYNGSTLEVLHANLSSAVLKTVFRDTIIKSVLDPPPNPDLTDIKQWVEYRRTSSDAYSQINFFYPDPVPNNVAADNISIYEYDGVYVYGDYITYNVTYNAVTNETHYIENNRTGMHWEQGNWTRVFTLVSPSERLIISPYMTNYSVFAPFGDKKPPEPEPEPEPQPAPSPSGGGEGSSGGGVGPSKPGENELQRFLQTIKLELTLPDNVTLMQGEAGRAYFNVTNRGNATVYYLTVDPKVPFGWDKTNTSIPYIEPNSLISDFFQMAPAERALATTYYVPVTLYTLGPGNVTVKVIERLLKVIVLPRGNLSRIRILEYSPTIQLAPFTSENVSFVAENVGDMDLEDITVRFSPNDCLAGVDGKNSVKKGEIKVISYTVRSAKQGLCDVNFEFYSKNKMVGFVPLTFDINPSHITGSAITKRIILVILLGAWTVLTVFLLNRKRKEQEK